MQRRGVRTFFYTFALLFCSTLKPIASLQEVIQEEMRMKNKFRGFILRCRALSFLEWRHIVALVCLFVGFAYSHFFPPFMGLGAVLGIVYVALNWRTIAWKDYWPLLFTVGYYLLLLINIPRSIAPEAAQNAAVVQIGYLLVPFIFVGLRFRKSWGTAIVLGSIAWFALALCKATISSFQIIDGRLLFYPFESRFYGQEDSFSLFREGLSFYTYSGLTHGLRQTPSVSAVFLIISLIISAYRCYTAQNKRVKWRYGSALFVLLVAIFLCNSRMGYLILACLFLAVTIRLLRAGNFRSSRTIWFMVLGLVGIGALVAFTRVGLFFDSSAGTIRAKIKNQPRMQLWVNAYENRAYYLPWGVGTEGERKVINDCFYSSDIDTSNFSYDNRLIAYHNTFIGITICHGIIGLALLLSMLIVPLLHRPRLYFRDYLILLSLFILFCFDRVGMLASGVVLISLSYNVLWLHGLHRDPTDKIEV